MRADFVMLHVPAALPGALLGGFHGLNPAMGWLFAVFLALQRRSRRALLMALLPIAAGHAASVAAIALIILAARSTLPVMPVRLSTALAVLLFGTYKLLTLPRHPRWVGLNVGYTDLAWWSFLMATAHGSGLMLAPLVLGVPGSGEAVWLLLVHNLAMLGVMAAMALLVYLKLGVMAVRRLWVNYDLLWAVCLLLAGAAALTGLLIAPAH